MEEKQRIIRLLLDPIRFYLNQRPKWMSDKDVEGYFQAYISAVDGVSDEGLMKLSDYICKVVRKREKKEKGEFYFPSPADIEDYYDELLQNSVGEKASEDYKSTPIEHRHLLHEVMAEISGYSVEQVQKWPESNLKILYAKKKRNEIMKEMKRRTKNEQSCEEV